MTRDKEAADFRRNVIPQLRAGAGAVLPLISILLLLAFALWPRILAWFR